MCVAPDLARHPLGSDAALTSAGVGVFHLFSRDLNCSLWFRMLVWLLGIYAVLASDGVEDFCQTCGVGHDNYGRSVFFLICSLRILYMFWSYSPFFVQLFPDLLHSLPSQLGVLFVSHKSQFVLPKYSWTCGLPLGHSQFISSFILRET